MSEKKNSGKYMKFFTYLVVVVLLNLAGVTLFQRWDLTQNNIYSLSDVSKSVVSTLTEPLTIKVFFTKDLPSPYNATERYLKDLLAEYALNGNRYFNYQFYNVTPQTEGGASDENQTLAQSYGIQAMQIQQLEQDEVKFKLAYMGLVIIHGDIVERIPSISSTDGLEYKLTTAIQKVNHKISSLLALSDNIQIKVILSSSLTPVAPLMGLNDLPNISRDIEEIVNTLNQKNYGRLAFSSEDPRTDEEQDKATEAYQAVSLKWPEIKQKNIPAGRGVAGLYMSYKEKSVSLPFLQVLRIPLIGTQYQLATKEELTEMIGNQVESLIDVNENLGYLSDHGTLSLGSGSYYQQDTGALSTFSSLAGGTYSLKNVPLTEGSVPQDVKCLVIARPTESFSDYDLFQIDQALMRGQNLAIFLEPFKESTSSEAGMASQSQSTGYQPLDTGLEKLLAHWGVSVKKSIIMDENCYHQTLSKIYGGGEKPIYFAPIVQMENINQSLDYMRNIKELIALKVSPLELDAAKLKENGLKSTVLLSSSEKSWEMTSPINYNPLYHSPPENEKELNRKTIACMIEGSFPSYFAGKSIPEKASSKDEHADPSSEEGPPETADDGTVKPDSAAADISSDIKVLDKGKPAKVFLLGTGAMLQDDVLDSDGKSTNSMFVMNILDALNDHEATALMRSKNQSHNPLEQLSAQGKTVVKIVNIAGLPVFAILFGLFVWSRRHLRKKAIRKQFEIA